MFGLRNVFHQGLYTYGFQRPFLLPRDLKLIMRQLWLVLNLKMVVHILSLTVLWCVPSSRMYC